MQKLPTGKTPGHVALEAGDGFLVEVGGGGGFWDSLERDPERVLADVRSGYVSLESARRDYGVVINQEGRCFELDVESDKSIAAKNGKRATLMNLRNVPRRLPSPFHSP